jgi:antitoxin MazE
MQTSVQRWGNSLAVRIPHLLAEETQLREGTAVEMAVSRGQLVVARSKRKKYRLADLLKSVKKSRLHGEQFADGPTGREIW